MCVTKKRGRILINPPPRDRRCACCGRRMEDLDRKRLYKDWRELDGMLGAFWVCAFCFGLDDETYWRLYRAAKQERAEPFHAWCVQMAKISGISLETLMDQEDLVDRYCDQVSSQEITGTFSSGEET